MNSSTLQDPPALFPSSMLTDDRVLRRRRMEGIACGWTSAIFYTLANTALRQVADADPVWISCLKAIPMLVMVSPWFAWRAARKMPLVSRWRDVGLILFGASMAQFVGNCLFQWSLGVVGLAIAMPVTLGAVLISSAILGGRVLGESVTARSWSSVSVLVLAVLVLSLGAGDAYRSMHESDVQGTDVWWVVAGVAGVFVAGIAYSILGMTIGKTSAHGLPSATILLASGFVGVIGLGSVVFIKDGPQIIVDTTTQQWRWALVAGTFNGFAFIALTMAIRMIGLLNVNVLNASQTAAAAILGVWLFAEPVTAALVCGVVLTVVGLLMMPRVQTRDESRVFRDIGPTS